ncbi:ABC transporter permease, partial [Paenarthrobacter sp. CM16]|uniref:ABC transporter permease n=1 Tax=Paenarthrobacter sp. CM16 TaxID=2738447 RepID=UPI0015519C39
VQFMPVVVVPQILLCGLFVSREDMNEVLDSVSGILPLTFSVEALTEIAGNTEATAALWQDATVMGGIVVGVLVLASLTLRRRTK